jgi:uncharacterized protein (TIGR02001 family)
MKKTLLSLSIAAAAVTMPTQAADIGGGLDLSGNMSMVSDYVWRGMDQNSNSPAIQGGLDLAHTSGLYVGVWGSSAGGAGSDYSMELDVYGGYATELAGIGVDVGFIAYMYPSDTAGTQFDEAYLGLSKDFGGVELGVTYYEGMGSSGDSDNLEFSASTELAGLGLSAVYGDYDNNGEYYSFGVSKELLSDKWPVEVALTYSEMDFDAAGTPNHDTVVFSVSKSF